MACIEKIYSVSALIGSCKCNANCKFCAGKYLRKEATTKIPSTFKSAIKLCARYGGWSLSLTSSGEPTCDPDSVTNALIQYNECAKEGAFFPNVNLFTNGIILDDDAFCHHYFPLWKSLGLTSIVVSIHHHLRNKQAEIYGIDSYPQYDIISENIRKHGLQPRATLLLQKNLIDNVHDYQLALDQLILCGFHNVTSWSIGNPDGSRNEFTPSRFNLLAIRTWLAINATKCHGHSWGGGVYDYKGKIIRYTDYVTKHNRHKNFVRQLVVFQDGTVAYSWIKNGALCMMS